MIEKIKGNPSELTPSYVVLETASGFSYEVHISLHTFSKLEKETKELSLFTHFIVREDAQLLYGFFDKNERQIFRLLLGVSGVGANTARLILSSLEPIEVQNAILNNDTKSLNKIKGIGTKTAQRIIIDLKDKIGGVFDDKAILESNIPSTSSVLDEASSALEVLGFQKKTIKTVLDKIITENPELKLEVIIKEALKRM